MPTHVQACINRHTHIHTSTHACAHTYYYTYTKMQVQTYSYTHNNLPEEQMAEKEPTAKQNAGKAGAESGSQAEVDLVVVV